MIKTHPRQLYPVWLDGPITYHELTRYSAKKLAKELGINLPKIGEYIQLPYNKYAWSELHNNPGRDKPFYVF